ncbi:hypothetical protein [Mycobacterium sp. AZCC_0083]|uniref:hypothetical protein n=1 Tax=Mycobacterium sp. AZCC_0083 TaxID=2735882 RepID=UPI0016075433|nr:hypothetical protein [Mycobacterium sp. AZCC_0083]MBB5167175.1 hypothetical protein [Mycobacterium sp. AZCC_0083]
MTKILIAAAAAAATLGLSACNPGEPVPTPANPGAPASCAFVNAPKSGFVPGGDLRLDPGTHLGPRIGLPFQ